VTGADAPFLIWTLHARLVAFAEAEGVTALGKDLAVALAAGLKSRLFPVHLESPSPLLLAATLHPCYSAWVNECVFNTGSEAAARRDLPPDGGLSHGNLVGERVAAREDSLRGQ